MVPRFGVSAECQSIGTSGKKKRACYLAQKLSVGAYFELSFQGCGSFLGSLGRKAQNMYQLRVFGVK